MKPIFRRWLTGVFCAAWALALWQGCATSQSADAGDPGMMSEQILKGDTLSITIIRPDQREQPLPLPEQKVTEAGTIALDLIGSVKAVGKTTKELEQDISNAYVPGFYKRITVIVRASDRCFYVGGCVRNPNRFAHAGDLTVLKAIDSAGGFTDYAKKGKVQLTRANGQRFTIDCEAALKNPKLDLPVHPGDRIHVPQRYT